MKSPDDKLPDNSLIEQLGRLGAAAEGSVNPTTADAVVRSTELLDAPLVELNRPRRGRMALAAAAALVLIAGFGAVFFARTQEAEPASELATQQPDELENDVPFPVADDNGWEELRFCESSGQYDIDTGNTFYGAYQFTQAAWEAVGGTGNPADASPLEQDLRAAALYEAQGAEPWPVCNRFIDGPMPNPLVLSWEQARLQPHQLAAYVGVDATVDERATIQSRLEALTQAPATLVPAEVLAAELEDVLPAGIEVPADQSLLTVPLEWDSIDEAAIEPLTDVAALGTIFVQPRRPSTRIEIPALGIDQLSPASWRLDDLRFGVVAVAPTGWPEVPGSEAFAAWSQRERERSYSSFTPLLPDDGPLVIASAAWDLSRLTEGDLVRISVVVDPNQGIESAVNVLVAGAAQDRHIDQLTGSGLDALGGVVLIAPHPDDTDKRIVVRTQSPDRVVARPSG